DYSCTSYAGSGTYVF
nr:immunoglobulin light chain junction region [Macaca mulatta]MOV94556.1 immunoglobulin light chain junction region [Macaca mulatta]MOV98482.1 immunoglobulin light chain junction region [Macaca mulatta]MOV99218.1 immunoglobulin light chain junction region [Macaca mulatta]